jgi:hypothetical protein
MTGHKSEYILLNSIGHKVEGLFNGTELSPLTAVYDDLAAKSFQLSGQFHKFFYNQTDIVLQMAQANINAARATVQQQYTENLQRLTEMVNAEFGTDKISW